MDNVNESDAARLAAQRGAARGERGLVAEVKRVSQES